MIELRKKIIEIEKEYLELLESIKEKKETLSLIAVLDSIRLFWFKNRNIVSLYLFTLKEKEVFSYSGATYLDISSKDYYGFLVCGKIHVMDDQLYKYADTVLLKDSFPSRDKFINQVFKTLEDNISVLKELSDIVILLPIRLFFEKTNFYEIAEGLFLDFFDKKFSTVQDYLNICHTSKDIDSFFREDLKKSIFIHDKDTHSKGFEERINDIPKEIYGTYEIGQAFLFSLMGYLIQSLEIIETIHQYNIIPIIRNDVTLSYVYILERNIPDNQEIVNKTGLANTIYRLCRKHINIFENMSPREIYKKYGELDIFSKLYGKLDLTKKFIDEIRFENRVKCIEEFLLK